jgi:hypothetical protein
MYMLICVVFWIISATVQARWMLQTYFGFNFFLLVGMGLNAVALAVLISAFFDRSITAAVVGYELIISTMSSKSRMTRLGSTVFISGFSWSSPCGSVEL